MAGLSVGPFVLSRAAAALDQRRPDGPLLPRGGAGDQARDCRGRAGRPAQGAAADRGGGLGGMVVPAAVYLLGLWGRPGTHGWGVPMATDIAFVVGFLTLLGPASPTG